MIARLQTAGVICLETFKEFAAMARFTLRDEGEWGNQGVRHSDDGHGMFLFSRQDDRNWQSPQACGVKQ